MLLTLFKSNTAVVSTPAVYVPGDNQAIPTLVAPNAAPPKIPSLGSALLPGSVNKKYLVFFGLTSADGTEISAVPRGTFVAQSATGTESQGQISNSLHCFDIVTEFDFPIYNDIPHPLYGAQSDIRYDANYNLTNPSGDLQTYVCDAKMFMTTVTDNAFFSANYQDIFGAVIGGSPVGVYVGTETSPCNTPVAASTYNWYPTSGTVIFNTPQAAGSIVSIDGVPQAMAPELMIQHLFCDYAMWDPVAMSLQQSNMLLPTYTGGRGQTVWQCAQDIAALTAPRFVAWQLRIDEYGQINFYESRVSTVPTETLIDERDLFNINYTYTTQQLANVVEADSVSNTNQPLTSIAYNVESINDDGERNSYQIPANRLLCTRGMVSTEAISVLNSYTAAELDRRSRPKLQIIVDVLPNYNRQIGDQITVLEKALGLSGPYIIKGMEDRINQAQAVQTLRIERANIFANMNMGLPGGVTNATPQTLALNTQPIGDRTGIISTVSINGVNAIYGGLTAKDSYGSAILPVVTPTNGWQFSVSIDATQAFDTCIFHYIYLTVPSTLAGVESLMAFQLPVFDQGKVTAATTIAAGYTTTDTHTTGCSIASNESAYLYNNIIVAGTATTLPPNWGSYIATINNTTAAQPYLGTSTVYGLGVGSYYGGNPSYLPNQKQSYGFFCILAANANGAMSFQRIPFILSL